MREREREREREVTQSGEENGGLPMMGRAVVARLWFYKSGDSIVMISVYWLRMDGRRREREENRRDGVPSPDGIDGDNRI
ncbi:hypothetical protein U1Q18_042159 [Sarracenia purpurea var. burkii]